MSVSPLRYLVKEPDVYDPHHGVIIKGHWHRTWKRAWDRFHGEKRIMVGRRVVVHVEAMAGWG